MTRTWHPCLRDPLPLDPGRSGERAGGPDDRSAPAPERPAEGAPIREAIADRVDEIIREVTRQRPGWSPPPFPPEVYAEALGIRVIAADRPPPGMEDLDALLVPIGERPEIIYNAQVRSRGRVAFSIAHEIGHLLFEDRGVRRYRYRTRRKVDWYPDEEERRLEHHCDLAAAELLMPRRWFRAALEETGARASAVCALAERYGVSREAAALRIAELLDGPCAVGFFELARPSRAAGSLPGATAAGRVAYRARRVFRSRGFPFLFPPGKSVPDLSVVYRASLTRGELGAIEEFRLGAHRALLHVRAVALHRSAEIAEPPLVCALFSPAA